VGTRSLWPWRSNDSRMTQVSSAESEAVATEHIVVNPKDVKMKIEVKTVIAEPIEKTNCPVIEVTDIKNAPADDDVVDKPNFDANAKLSHSEDKNMEESNPRSKNGHPEEWSEPQTRQKGLQGVAIEDLMEVLYTAPDPLDFKEFCAVFKGRGFGRKILQGRWAAYRKTYHSKKYQCSNYAVTDFVSKQLDASQANGRPRRNIKQVKRLSPIFKRKGMVPLGSGKNPWVKTADSNSIVAHVLAAKRRAHLQESLARSKRGRRSSGRRRGRGRRGRPPLGPHTWPKKRGNKRRRREDEEDEDEDEDYDEDEDLEDEDEEETEPVNTPRSKPNGRRKASTAPNGDQKKRRGRPPVNRTKGSAREPDSGGRDRPQREKREVKRLSPFFRRNGYVPIHNPDLEAHKQSYSEPGDVLRNKLTHNRPTSTRGRRKSAASMSPASPGSRGKPQANSDGNRLKSPRPPRNVKNLTVVSSGRPARRLPGVTWSAVRGRWEAETSHQGVKMHIGYFGTERAAREAVDMYRERMGWPPRPSESVIPTSSLTRVSPPADADKSGGFNFKRRNLMPRDVTEGTPVDACAGGGRWFEAQVVEVKGRKKGRERFLARVHFLTGPRRPDSWLPLADLARPGTKSRMTANAAASAGKRRKSSEARSKATNQSNEKNKSGDLYQKRENSGDKDEMQGDEIDGDDGEGVNEGPSLGKYEDSRPNKRPRPDYCALSRGEKQERSEGRGRPRMGQAEAGVLRGEYIGIWPQRKRWRACISHNGQRMHLGSYATAELAARAWDAKARELRGPGTKTNFPLSSSAATPSPAQRAKPGPKPGSRRSIPAPKKQKLTKPVPALEIPAVEKQSKEQVTLVAGKETKVGSNGSKAVPWVDDLTPRSSRRAKPKNYRLMEKGNFNEVFALQLKAFRLRAKQQQAKASPDSEGEKDRDEDETESRRGRSRVPKDDIKEDENKQGAKPGQPPSRSPSRSPARRRSPRRRGESLQKVGSGSGMFGKGEILAIFAGQSSVDGEPFWLFECEQPSDGSNVNGFYYRKDSEGRYERDPSAPRQRISVDSVMRDFRGCYVTFKHKDTSGQQKWVDLTRLECTELQDLAAEILKMQGITDPSNGLSAPGEDDLLAASSSNVQAANSADVKHDETATPATGGNRTTDDVLGLTELPMQLRTLLEDPIESATGGSADATNAGAMFSVDAEENVMLAARSSGGAPASTDGLSSSLVDVSYKPMGDQPMKMFDKSIGEQQMKIFSEAADDKVASMFLQ